MNLGQLRTATYTRCGTSTTDGLLTATSMTDAVNEAMHSLNAEMDWEWLQAAETITTIAGTDLYTPGGGTFINGAAGTWMRTLDIRHSDDRSMDFWDGPSLRERWALVAATEPLEWGVEVNQVILRPIPDGVYTLRHTYLVNDVDLSADGDVPLVPTSEHYAIVELATVLALRRDVQNTRVQMAQAAYDAWLTRARNKRLRVNRPHKVRVRQGYDL